MCFSEKLCKSNNFQQMKQNILIILLMTYAPENIDADIYILPFINHSGGVLNKFRDNKMFTIKFQIYTKQIICALDHKRYLHSLLMHDQVTTYIEGKILGVRGDLLSLFMFSA